MFVCPFSLDQLLARYIPETKMAEFSYSIDLDEVAQNRYIQIYMYNYYAVTKMLLNFLTTKKQMTKFLSANFQKMLSSKYIILRIQRPEGKQSRSR